MAEEAYCTGPYRTVSRFAVRLSKIWMPRHSKVSTLCQSWSGYYRHRLESSVDMKLTCLMFPAYRMQRHTKSIHCTNPSAITLLYRVRHPVDMKLYRAKDSQGPIKRERLWMKAISAENQKFSEQSRSQYSSSYCRTLTVTYSMCHETRFNKLSMSL